MALSTPLIIKCSETKSDGEAVGPLTVTMHTSVLDCGLAPRYFSDYNKMKQYLYNLQFFVNLTYTINRLLSQK